MKIYTKTGDAGKTGLWGGKRVSKSALRVAAYGDVDELSSVLGWVMAALESRPDAAAARKTLERVQKELFDVGAFLAGFAGAMDGAAAERLEREIDLFDKDLKPMRRFILPGGGEAGSRLHVARAVCRRAERSVVALAAKEEIGDGIVRYLNRLSDYLFTAARWVNARDGRSETEWEGLPKK